MLETLRERLLSVQQDFTSGLKTLSDKSREAKVKSKPRSAPCLPKYSAGLELLSRYEDTWAALHRRAKECADAGELVDSEVVMLSAHWEKKKASLVELQEQLQQLPGLIADLESMTASLTHLEASFEEVEDHLLHLEDLCGQCELERQKHMHSQQLENYKKSKRKELEIFKEPMGSMSSMEVNVDMLEQMDLMDISDQEALDVFLNSGGEEGAAQSPVTGPEPQPCGITLEVPHPSPFLAEPPSSPCPRTGLAAQEASEGSASPLVQSDEEEVQVDTALATLQPDSEATADASDDSDSARAEHP
ncbi:dysbindin isoform X2 [Oryctolagus cuniculus]|uniref:dysbindin isoform X2 n=1 Tax=Oryctolagus cuniculus TaxID=9986 RepID=UPI00222E1849|nr:dysbindin isoform X2 [Oryctolagus cuniculus]